MASNRVSWALVAVVSMLMSSACAGRQGEPVATAEPERTAQQGMTTQEEGLAVQQRSDVGAFLTDADGRAVYLLEEDPVGESICYDACAEAWPPVLVSAGAEALDPSIQSERIGTIERRDGTRQLTYDDQPLYYYERDVGPGSITGHDVHDEWGGWYLVAPTGEAIHTGSS